MPVSARGATLSVILVLLLAVGIGRSSTFR
jgi:hypothetical protein